LPKIYKWTTAQKQRARNCFNLIILKVKIPRKLLGWITNDVVQATYILAASVLKIHAEGGWYSMASSKRKEERK
jgi:hypothetical protein